jgi:DHA1 family tetracycline resistance protein-like MFS transporter
MTQETEIVAAQTSKLALTFIFITALLDSIGLGIIIPVWPKLIAELAHVTITGAAWWGQWIGFAYAGMQFLCAPFIGNLSDRFGRRPVLIASLLALGIDYGIMGFAPTLAWLFVGRFLSGIAGAAYPTIGAYIADVTPPEKRASGFGVMGAAFSVGFILGPAMGGILGEYGSRVPFFAAAALSLANALFGLFVLKESLAKEHRRAFEWQRANPVGALRAMRRFPMIVGLIAVIVLMRLAHDANPVLFTYYVMLKFHWSTAMVGYSMATIGATLGIVYMFLIRIVIPKIGETNSVYLGLLGGAAAFAGYAFASNTVTMFVFVGTYAVFGFAGPALNAIMSKLVGPKEQGELQGALACVGSLTSVAAPVILTQIFVYFSGASAPVYFPGAGFLAASLFLVAAVLVFTRLRTRQPAVAAPEPAE